MNTVLEESWVYYDTLKNKMENSQVLVESLQDFIINIKNTCETFSNSLRQSAEDFYMKIAENPDEDEENLLNCNFISNYILNTSFGLNQKQSDIMEETLDPLQQFISNYTETNSILKQQVHDQIQKLEQQKNNLAQIHEVYLKESYKLNKHKKEIELLIQNNDKEAVTHEMAERISRSATLKEKVDDSYIDYKNQIVEVNRSWLNFDKEFKASFNSFDLNEESRAHFTNVAVHQLLKNMTQFFQVFDQPNNQAHIQKFQGQLTALKEVKKTNKPQFLQNITRSRKIDIFQIQKKEDFISFDEWLKAKENNQVKDKNFNSEEISLIKSQKNYSQNLQSITTYISMVVAHQQSLEKQYQLSKQSTDKDQTFLEQQNQETQKFRIKKCETFDLQLFFKELQYRKGFITNIIQILDNLQTRYLELSEEDYNYFIKIFYNLSIAVEHDTQNFDIQDFYAIIISLVTFVKHREDRSTKRVHLGSEFSSDCTIFFHREKWKQLQKFMVDRNKSQYKQNSNKKKEEQQSKNQEKKKNGFKSFFKKSKKAMGQFFSNDKEEELKQQQSIAKPNKMQNIFDYNHNSEMIEDISNILLKINLKVSVSCEIIIFLSQEYKIRLNDIVQILEIQENRNFLDSNDQQYNRHQQRKIQIEKKLKKYQNLQLFSIYQALKYLDPKKDYFSILLVNKQWNQCLQSKIKKQTLSYFKEPILPETRKSLWLATLNQKPKDLNYQQLITTYEKITQDDEQQQRLEQLIKMDVLRSFQRNKSCINHDDLQLLLNYYSVYNSQIGYCQGMNFIMGFLLMFFNDKQVTFEVFTQIIDKTLTAILQNDLTYIRVLFYKMDRLLQIFVPNVADHLKNMKIEASHFSTSWFLTIFTSNCCNENGYQEIIYEIWDIFLKQRWKGLFKIIICIFQFYEDIILKMKFDELMSFLNNLVKSEFYQNLDLLNAFSHKDILVPDELLNEVQPLTNIKEKISNIKISNQLLQTLETEHFVLKDKISNMMTKIQK